MSVIRINESTKASQFWKAVEIYYKRPNSINKQVLFSEDVLVSELCSPLLVTECNSLFDNICLKLSKQSIGSEKLSESNTIEIKNADIFSFSSEMCMVVRILHPKNIVNDCVKFYEGIFLDFSVMKVYIFTKSVQKNSDKQLDETKIHNPFAVLKFNFLQLSWSTEYLEISYNENLEDKGLAWLQATFVPKFKKLMYNGGNNMMKNKNGIHFDNNVDIVQYYKFYNDMKLKYGKFFVENWTENTDPKKFVYEDIGIATYLMMLWNEGNIPERNSKKQKFVDLGCGNGLLVHILNSEGHLGIGLDIRKRKIWDIYPSTTILQEKTIIPSYTTTFPQADWLIGNHSDELTAWIPIMARLSNSHCQYFVLPCCPYELNGMKFQRKNSSLSSYQDFINYVKEISVLCEFETTVDKLRIPSTKRICLVGFNKSEMSEDEYMSVRELVVSIINEDCEIRTDKKGTISTKTGNQNGEVALNIKVRESVEPVRNCTKLPKGCIDSVLKNVMNELLKEQIIYTVNNNDKFLTWNRGRKVSIAELASRLDKNSLMQLKNECKGLQTLLKNHHFLFEVSQGHVQFRSPDSMLELSKKFSKNCGEKWKLKKCWFFNNHPDNCPLSNNQCSFKHVK